MTSLLFSFLERINWKTFFWKAVKIMTLGLILYALFILTLVGAVPAATTTPFEVLSYESLNDSLAEQLLAWTGSSPFSQWLQENAFTTITAMFLLLFLFVMIFILERKKIYHFLNKKIGAWKK